MARMLPDCALVVVLCSLLAFGLASTAEAGLVAHLTFDNTLEDQANDNDGTFVGGEPAYVAGFDGTANSALSFDGANDYVNVAQNTGLPITNVPAYTIAMWVKGGPQSDKRVFSEGSSSNNTPLLNIGSGTSNAQATDKMSFFRRPGPQHIDSLRVAFDDTWHHIAVVDDNGRVSFYIDGVFDSWFSYTRQELAVNTTTVGGILRGTPCCFFTGAIDEVHIYDHALTDAEVEALVPNPDGCPEEGDTTCDSLEVVSGPIGDGPGWYDISASGSDGSGDLILYDLKVLDEAGDFIDRTGFQAESDLRLFLAPGTWTVIATADDDLGCLDKAEGATRELEITVVDTPEPTCVSHWTFDGDLLDSGPGGNHGTFVGEDIPPFTTGHDGTPNGAIQLDGVDDYVDCAHNNSLPIYANTAYTVAMWVKGDGVTQDEKRIFSESSSTSDNPLVNLSTDRGTAAPGSTGKLDLYLRPDATLVSHVLTDRIALDGEWHHIAFVDDDGRITVYIDGIKDALRVNYVKPYPAFDITTIGGILRLRGSSHFFAGAVDDVRLCNYALSEEEVIALVPEPDDCVDDADTHCDNLLVTGPSGPVGPAGDVEGTYTLEGQAIDVSGDAPLFYTFLVTDEEGNEIQVGPQNESSAEVLLTPGVYSVSVTVDDRLLCRDEAIDATCVRDDVIVRSEAPLRISHWSFDGDLLDPESANDGTFIGEAAPPFVQGYDCADPGALEFDGTDDYVLVAQTSNLPLYNKSAFTIAMWLNGLPQVDRRVWSEGSSTSNNPLFNLGTESTGATGALDFFLRNDTGGMIATHVLSTTMVFDGTWHHIAWVDDDGAVTLYVDGVPDATDFSYTRPTLTLNTTTIGGILRGDPGYWFDGMIDDVQIFNYPLAEEEVLGLVGDGPITPCCPAEGDPEFGDTRCTGIDVSGPERDVPGDYTVTATAQDSTGDPVLYSFTADNGMDPPMTAGPQAGNSAMFTLDLGEWEISVTVDDDPECDDVGDEATCTDAILVVPRCPSERDEEFGDTRCTGINVEGPEGDIAGDYTVTATSDDGTGDPVLYTFTADNGLDPALTAGPQSEASAMFTLDIGEWEITVTVDDDLECDDVGDEATCTDTVVVVPPGGLQVPGDCNQDGNLDISDAVCAFGVLFTGTPASFPCGDGSSGDPANILLMNFNGDDTVDISDGVAALNYLFSGGPPHPLAVPGEERTGCVRMLGCPDSDPCAGGE